MSKIKIVQVPPGFAPEDIRKEWVGVEIPLADNPIIGDKVVAKIGNQNKDGYQVRGVDAVQALLDAGKNEAADFWKFYATGNFVFKKEVCELIKI
jgi:hypothetical protein